MNRIRKSIKVVVDVTLNTNDWALNMLHTEGFMRHLCVSELNALLEKCVNEIGYTKAGARTVMTREIRKRLGVTTDTSFAALEDILTAIYGAEETGEPTIDITEKQVDFALNCQMEDPSKDEEAGFYGGVSWLIAFLNRNRR